MEINFDLQLSSKDYTKFKLFHYKQLLWALPILLKYFIQFNIRKNPMESTLIFSFFSFILISIFILIFKTIQFYNTDKTYKLILNTNQQITVNEEGFHSLSNSFDIHVAFDKIKKVYETLKYTYIYTDKNNIFILPTYKIESLETTQTLQTILKNKLGRKYKVI